MPKSLARQLAILCFGHTRPTKKSDTKIYKYFRKVLWGSPSREPKSPTGQLVILCMLRTLSNLQDQLRKPIQRSAHIYRKVQLFQIPSMKPLFIILQSETRIVCGACLTSRLWDSKKNANFYKILEAHLFLSNKLYIYTSNVKKCKCSLKYTQYVFFI